LTAFGLVVIWRTLLASEAATRAAVEAVEVTRVMGERQLRAYLTVRSLLITGIAVGQAPELKWQLENTGMTPARNVRIVSHFSLTTDPELHKYRFRRGKPTSRIEIGGGNGVTQGNKLPVRL
jgi:hypothetical protein